MHIVCSLNPKTLEIMIHAMHENQKDAQTMLKRVTTAYVVAQSGADHAESALKKTGKGWRAYADGLYVFPSERFEDAFEVWLKTSAWYHPAHHVVMIYMIKTFAGDVWYDNPHAANSSAGGQALEAPQLAIQGYNHSDLVNELRAAFDKRSSSLLTSMVDTEDEDEEVDQVDERTDKDLDTSYPFNTFNTDHPTRKQAPDMVTVPTPVKSKDHSADIISMFHLMPTTTTNATNASNDASEVNNDATNDATNDASEESFEIISMTPPPPLKVLPHNVPLPPSPLNEVNNIIDTILEMPSVSALDQHHADQVSPDDEADLHTLLERLMTDPPFSFSRYPQPEPANTQGEPERREDTEDSDDDNAWLEYSGDVWNAPVVQPWSLANEPWSPDSSELNSEDVEILSYCSTEEYRETVPYYGITEKETLHNNYDHDDGEESYDETASDTATDNEDDADDHNSNHDDNNNNRRPESESDNTSNNNASNDTSQQWSACFQLPPVTPTFPMHFTFAMEKDITSAQSDNSEPVTHCFPSHFGFPMNKNTNPAQSDNSKPDETMPLLLTNPPKYEYNTDVVESFGCWSESYHQVVSRWAEEVSLQLHQEEEEQRYQEQCTDEELAAWYQNPLQANDTPSKTSTKSEEVSWGDSYSWDEDEAEEAEKEEVQEAEIEISYPFQREEEDGRFYFIPPKSYVAPTSWAMKSRFVNEESVATTNTHTNDFDLEAQDDRGYPEEEQEESSDCEEESSASCVSESSSDEEWVLPPPRPRHYLGWRY